MIFVFPFAPSQPKPILAQIFSSFLCKSSIIAKNTFTQISLCPSANRLNIAMAAFLSILASEYAFSLDWTMLAATAKQRNLPRLMVWHLWLMRSKVEFGVTFCCCLQQNSKMLRSCLWIRSMFYSFVLAGIGFQNQLLPSQSRACCSASFFCSVIYRYGSGSVYCTCSTYFSSSFSSYYFTLAISLPSSFFSSLTSCFSVTLSCQTCSLLFLGFFRSQCTANISLFSMQYLSKLTAVSLLNSLTCFFQLSCTKASIFVVKPFLRVLFNLGLLSYFWKLKMSYINFRHLSLLSEVVRVEMGRVPSK